MTNRKKELEGAYQQLHKELMAILYEEDPANLGFKIGAPTDEYSEEASRLIVALKSSRNREDIGQIIRQMFGSASSPLIDRARAAWAKFVDVCGQNGRR